MSSLRLAQLCFTSVWNEKKVSLPKDRTFNTYSMGRIFKDLTYKASSCLEKENETRKQLYMHILKARKIRVA
jgi:hypothetical protein